MKILKPGKVEQREFVCDRCGCVFVASKEEVDGDGDCLCPTIGCIYFCSWDSGEPYEEPTPTQTDRERLAQLLRETQVLAWTELPEPPKFKEVSHDEAIGALAEICGEFYRQLMEQGFSQAEAIQLTSDYLRATITPPQKNIP